MLALILLGMAAGLVAGLFGVGGGVIFVPALIYVAGLNIHQAIGVSLAVIIPTSLSGFLTHLSSGKFEYHIAIMVALGGVIGGYLGASLSLLLPAAQLKKLFAVVLGVIALLMFFDNSRKPEAAVATSESQAETERG